MPTGPTYRVETAEELEAILEALLQELEPHAVDEDLCPTEPMNSEEHALEDAYEDPSPTEVLERPTAIDRRR